MRWAHPPIPQLSSWEHTRTSGELLAPKRLGLWLSLAAFAPLAAEAVDLKDTRLLAEPDVHKETTVFVYDHDVWISKEGQPARRLTTALGAERHPHLSPDGRLVAFSAHYDGNQDVYLIPASGGTPRRLTWHGGADWVDGFLPDGRVLFSSQRDVSTYAHVQMFSVAPSGGFPARLPIPDGDDGAVSTDGKRVAYTTSNRWSRENLEQWRNYRGGRHARIWVTHLETLETTEIPQPTSGCNDLNPVWLGETLYFLSDREGPMDVYAYPPSGGVRRMTQGGSHDRRNLNGGGGRLVYEQGGQLFTLEPGHPPEPHSISVGADLRERRPRFASGPDHIRTIDLAPDGARAVLGYRGEIVTVPKKHGQPRYLSRSPGAHDRSPAWSPDGQQIAWFSDASGEVELLVGPQDGAARARAIPLPKPGFYFDLKWSPDGQRVSFRDHTQSLFILMLSSERAIKVAQETMYSPIVTLHHTWSPDSRWLAFTLREQGLLPTLFLYRIEDGKRFQVTDGLIEVGEPAFDKNGKMLYFVASTEAGPVRDWFSQWVYNFTFMHRVYALTLDAAVPSPARPRSDEVAAPKKNKNEEDNEETPPVKITFDSLSDRIVPLSVGEGAMRGLRAGSAGELFLIRTRGERGSKVLGAPGDLIKFDVEQQKETILTGDAKAFWLAGNGKSVLIQDAQGNLFSSPTDKPVGPQKTPLPVGRVRVQVKPEVEWAHIAREAWRINRDYFYDPNFHGADWNAVWAKYERLLPHAATRNDLERIIRWMLGELGVGHSFSSAGEGRDEPRHVNVGLLGADFEVDGSLYRFRKIYSGLTWRPKDRAPLRQPGIDVKEGEYLFAVDGEPVLAVKNVYRYFQGTADRPVRLKIGPHRSGRGARHVEVRPIARDHALRVFDWVESNRRRVDQASAGRVAYVYLPNTAELGHEFFNRYFYPQSHKEALIIDERFNGGGLIADSVIDILRRRPIGYWALRYGQDQWSPRSAVFGPKVMIIDENAGSGGDLLPWMFKEFSIGPLVGKRTWGGLVGILGFPPLMDGSQVTAPNIAFYTHRGWEVENVGVHPDIEIEQWPKDVERGRDPQLERAIEEALRLLKTQPSQKPAPRPKYPIRIRP